MGYLRDNADIIYAKYLLTYEKGSEGCVYLNQAAYYIGVEDFSNAASKLGLAAAALLAAYDYVGDVAPYHRNSWYWTDSNWPEEYELTWQDICIAWAKDDFAGRAMTIGFIDRMRQLLWDEPYYIAFASRPEEQEL